LSVPLDRLKKRWACSQPEEFSFFIHSALVLESPLL
jgi:hypothetical protein